MMKNLLVLTLFFLSIFLLSCNDESFDEILISGTLLNLNSGEAISDMLIRIEGYEEKIGCLRDDCDDTLVSTDLMRSSENGSFSILLTPDSRVDYFELTPDISADGGLGFQKCIINGVGPHYIDDLINVQLSLSCE
ncbi:MAG: hypothetical protein JXR03_06380 [Cyclobacteriaceae bacterium]